MNGSRRHDSMESCRVTCSFCNSDRVRKERSVNSLAEATA
jgi:adenine C2-methylase RlmN of 23S rRNA A2503 and tRNA A37